jgi:hypothetical protein
MGKSINLSIKHPRPKRNRHLIAECRHSDDYVRCRCGWEGSVDGFPSHRGDLKHPEMVH